MFSKRDLVLFAIVAIVAILVQLAAINLITSPEHDEYAYTYNSLLWSGRINNATNIAWVERPPLFWWGMTSILALGASPLALLAVSPLFAVLLSLLIMQFAGEVTRDRRAGFAAGLFTAFSGFVGVMSAHVLTDAMGIFFATLSVYSFYKFFIEDKSPKSASTGSFFCILWGVSLALGLVARDENLVLIPIFALMWIFASSRASMPKKLFYAIIFLMIFGGPILLLGLVNTIQLASNLLTPIVLSGWWLIILMAGGLAWYWHENGFTIRRDLAVSFVGFFAIMLPFFFDNNLIAKEGYIGGTGILARPIAHLLMLPVTQGVGADLSMTGRAAAWISEFPHLITPLFVLLAIIGLYHAYGTRRRVLIFLFLWLVLSMGYVITEANLENRFLLIAFPSLALCAAFGVSFLWKINRWLGIVPLLATLPLINIFPNSPVSLNNETLVLGLASGTKNWMYGFLATQPLSVPAVKLALPNMIDGILGLVLGVGMTALIIGTSGFASSSRTADSETEPEKRLTPIAPRLSRIWDQEKKASVPPPAKPPRVNAYPKDSERNIVAAQVPRQPNLQKSPSLAESTRPKSDPKPPAPTSKPVINHHQPILRNFPPPAGQSQTKFGQSSSTTETAKLEERSRQVLPASTTGNPTTTTAPKIISTNNPPVLVPDSKFFQQKTRAASNAPELCQNCGAPIKNGTCPICARANSK
ncbi:MAG: glycosyltransferase family 39 protein [Nitrososphaerales archaeon]